MWKSNDLLNEQTAFSIERLTYQGAVKMPASHFHEHYEILYVERGERALFIMDNCFPLNKGYIAFIPPYSIHRTDSRGTSPQSRVLVNFTDAYIQPLVDLFGPGILACYNIHHPVLALSEEQRETVSRLFLDMLAEYQNGMPLWEARASSALLSLLTYASRLSREQLGGMGQNAESETVAKKMRQVARFIEQNYEKKITLDLLSKQFYLSPCYISRMFNKSMGVSLVRYVNQIRITKAQYLLETSGDITSVAYSTGFESLTHFERVFRSSQGMSPSEYHERARQLAEQEDKTDE